MRFESQCVVELHGNILLLLNEGTILFVTQIPASFLEYKRLRQPHGDHEALSVRSQCPYPEMTQWKMRKSLDGIWKPLLQPQNS